MSCQNQIRISPLFYFTCLIVHLLPESLTERGQLVREESRDGRDLQQADASELPDQQEQDDEEGESGLAEPGTRIHRGLRGIPADVLHVLPWTREKETDP